MPEYSHTAASCIAVAPSATPPHPSPQLRDSLRPSPRTSAFLCASAAFECGRTHTDPAKTHTRPLSEQTEHGLDAAAHQGNRNKINKSDRAGHFLLFYRWSQALNTGSHLNQKRQLNEELQFEHDRSRPEVHRCISRVGRPKTPPARCTATPAAQP